MPLFLSFRPSIPFNFSLFVQREKYLFQVLPFGLSTAMWSFTRVNPFQGHWRSQVVSVSSFRFVFLTQTYSAASRFTLCFPGICWSLGSWTFYAICFFFLVQHLEFLGVIIDPRNLSLFFSLPPTSLLWDFPSMGWKKGDGGGLFLLNLLRSNKNLFILSSLSLVVFLL